MTATAASLVRAQVRWRSQNLAWMLAATFALALAADASLAQGGPEPRFRWVLLPLATGGLVCGAAKLRFRDGSSCALGTTPLIVAAAVVAGPFGGAIVGGAAGIGALRRTNLRRLIVLASGRSLGGTAAGLGAFAWLGHDASSSQARLLAATLGLSSLTGFIALGLSYTRDGSQADDRFRERLTIALDAVAGAAVGFVLVRLSVDWGAWSTTTLLVPSVLGIATLCWYRERQGRVSASLREAWAAAEVRAQRDGLTGVGNRLAFDDALLRECERASRRDTGLGLVLLDIDHFKQLNDHFGHPAGDAVLRETARRLSARARAGDLVCRYGGEEFAVVATGLESDVDLALAAEALRMSLAATPYVIGGKSMRVTASAGAARGHGQTPEELVAHADAALYRAKRQGRDRTALHADGVTLPVGAE